jgi:threonine synthase
MIVLETAADQVRRHHRRSAGHEPERPAKFEGIEALPKRVVKLPADAEAG